MVTGAQAGFCAVQPPTIIPAVAGDASRCRRDRTDREQQGRGDGKNPSGIHGVIPPDYLADWPEGNSKPVTRGAWSPVLKPEFAPFIQPLAVTRADAGAVEPTAMSKPAAMARIRAVFMM